MNKSCLILLIMCMGILGLWAQENLQINGLNEAQYIHRTASDSLNSYFRDSFSFNLALRNFRFGMKFIAELPKYSNNQDEVLDELDSSRLAYAWKELYAAYEKEDFLIQAGTISETFGNGIVFRAWEDLEFDEDNRIQGFLAKVAGEKGTIKALYGAYDSEGDPDKSDLSYGVDVQSTSWKGISLGATALSNRSYYSPYYDYNQRDAFGARMNLILGGLDANLEYAISKLYKFGAFGRDGEARYAQASYNFSTIQIGSAYKYYRDFDTRLQDLPMANYHNEPLSDFQSGEDEEGLQGWINWQPSDQFNLILDYAEAWNSNQDRKMNDLFASLNYSPGSSQYGLDYSHIEKLDDELLTWSLESTPALNLGIPIKGNNLTCKAEYKYAKKTLMDQSVEHYEPKLQVDYSLGRVALSAGAQSWWHSPKDLMDSYYWTNIEARIKIYEHSDLTLFAGKEAGGKVCRNGTCRFVAPFEGYKVEISTRF